MRLRTQGEAALGEPFAQLLLVDSLPGSLGLSQKGREIPAGALTQHQADGVAAFHPRLFALHNEWVIERFVHLHFLL